MTSQNENSMTYKVVENGNSTTYKLVEVEPPRYKFARPPQEPPMYQCNVGDIQPNVDAIQSGLNEIQRVMSLRQIRSIYESEVKGLETRVCLLEQQIKELKEIIGYKSEFDLSLNELYGEEV